MGHFGFWLAQSAARSPYHFRLFSQVRSAVTAESESTDTLRSAPTVETLVRMLLSPAEPAPAASAVLGVLAVTALVLWIASRTIRRTEINYGTE